MISKRTLMAGLGGLAATACTPKKTASQTIELRISWWGGASSHKATLEALQLFMQRYPHIKVRGEYTGFLGHLERLTTQIAGNTAPDLMQINWYWQALFAREGRGFYDLKKLSDVIDFSQYDARTLGMGEKDGRRDALSVGNAARLFYFNQTTYQKAGLALPDSWESLVDAGPQMREKLGEAYYPIDGTFQDFIAMARSYTVQKTGQALVDDRRKCLNCTPEDMRDIARLYGDLTRNHSWPKAQTRASYGNVAQQEMRPWMNGEFAGCYQWNSSIDKYTDTLRAGEKVVLAPYPMRPGAKDAGLLYRPAMMFAVNRQSRHPEEAGLLLNFLLNDPVGIRAMGLKRGVPSSAIAKKTLGEDGELTGLKQDSEDQIARLPVTILESPWFEHPRVRDGFQDILEMQGYGRISEKEAGERMYSDINAILRRVIR